MSKENEIEVNEFEQFLNLYSNHYGYENQIETIRNNHFTRLQNSIYLDSVGSSLYSEIQLKRAFNEASISIFGNPHSKSNSSLRTTNEIEKARKMILNHFNVDNQQYSCIFTSGATQSLKLIGECFPWSNNSLFTYHFNSHTSVIGIRELAKHFGAKFETFTNNDIDELKKQNFHNNNNNDNNDNNDNQCFNLFAFSAECNFSGERINIDKKIIESLQNGKSNCNHKFMNKKWLVLIDAATLLSHDSLNLNESGADFIVLSFYKLFGFPTGLGALIIKNEIGHLLKKKYFGGGTVEALISNEDWVTFRGFNQSNNNNSNNSNSFVNKFL
eukprot:TRINITY_DN924_c0_g3_i3.p1 TRINITY_DN924_c0_g3~~TRINITY_DN924_c0_g3_i3.p1  ORF type:complete len:329 (-),score=113.96 TRINITY_DN924_c0_g3_i3:297-1283(-)